MNTRIPGYEITERLSESISSLIYRGYRIEDGQSVVLKVLRPEAATSESLSRFRHEFDITSRLHLPGVIKTYGLEQYRGSLVMVLEDTGGESLDRLLKQKQMSLRELLQLAIRLAEILGSIHQRSVVHKNINPSHIIWNPETGKLRLIDFDLAEKLPRRSVGLKPPSVLEGTLEYISPEQTGRMNCLIDYRTDFYSLGVTFYRMLTGKLPFQADDPPEWVQCHVARLPQSPEEIAPDLPPALSDIVMKLLAKAMDDRYQSAYGLQYDLEKCLAQWETSGRVAPFVLGTRDVSDRLPIPRKLYGREAESAVLVKAFDLMAASGVPEATSISSYSGIGKSSLVQELGNLMAPKRGYFISCKFDQSNRAVPYSMIVHAFRGLVQQILTESEDCIAFWKEQLQEALGANGQLIVDLIPHVESIIGPQPPVPQLPPTEAQNRFHMVFQNFVGVFTKAEHPIVLFLDDMQWLDEASLKLIEHLLTDPGTRYLFFMGAYPGNTDLHRENSERRRKEEELRYSEARYRTLYRDSPSMIFTLDAEGTILSVNPFAAVQLGYTNNELKGQPVLKVFHEDDRLAVAGQLQKSLRNPYQVYRWQFRKIRKDGSLLWVDELAQTVYDLNGILNILVVCHDITEFRRVQEALQHARDELEHRVQERTAELKASNILLSREIEEHHQTEKMLEEQEILFETILKQAADGIVVTDAQGKPLLANAAAKRMTMLDPESADLDTLRMDLGRPNNFNGYRIPLEKGSIPKALHGKMTVGIESRIMRPDGSYYDVLMSTAPLRKSDGVIFGTVSILSDITKRKQAEEALRSLPSRLLDAQEEERKRISRELHDSIGSYLSAVKYSMEHIANQMEQSAISHEPLSSLVSMVQQAIEELRRIMTDLRPSILDDLGIIAAVGWFCRQFQTIYPSIRIEKKVAIEEDDVPESLKIVIFRVMQEALNNAAKYSKADLVNLSLVKRENAIELTIEDNGVGFDLNSVCSEKERKGGGLGLTSMRERVDLSGGSFSLESWPGEGVKVHARWPMSSF
jgi:PAS domain S-box-containing protein